MNRLLLLFFFTLFFTSQTVVSQTETPLLISKDSVKTDKIDVLAPSKAAFYSALVPGLGQIYNKKYWKVPILYGGLATSIYFYVDNNKKYNDFRNEYKDRLNGTSHYQDDDPYYGPLDNNRLIEGQKFYRRNRDLSAFITIGIYILNIVDANVDAHLMQFNVNENLTVRPDINQNEINYKHNVGLTLNYNF